MRKTFDATDPATALAAAAFVLPPLAVLAPLGIAPLAGATALLTLILHRLHRACWPRLDRITTIAVAVFLAWSAITALWSLQPDRTLLTVIRVGAICVGGLVLIAVVGEFDAAQRRRAALGLLGGGALGALLLAVDFASGLVLHGLFVELPHISPVRVLNRTAAVAAILCWPVAALVGKRWGVPGFAGALVAAALLLLQFEPAVPLIAFGGTVGVFLLALWKPRAASLILVAALVVIVLLVPATPTLAPRLDSALTERNLNENSISHRLGIWAFGSGRILEKPVGGWGLHTSRAIPGGDRNLPILGVAHSDAPAMPLHPHNATIQIWLETGLPGLLLALFVVARGVLAIPRSGDGRIEVATLLAGATSTAIVANLSFGIWQGWWLCFIWLNVALSVCVLGKPARD